MPQNNWQPSINARLPISYFTNMRHSMSAHAVINLPRRLFNRNVGVDVLRTNKCIIQDVSSTCQWNKETCQVAAGNVGNNTLDAHHDCETANHSHERTRSNGSVFAKTFGSEVEDTAPHNRCAKTNEQEHQDAYRNIAPNKSHCGVVNARNAYCNVGRQEDTQTK